MTKVNYAGTGSVREGGGREGVQANLSSGKCIQMNVVILSNILRDAAAVAAAADVADAAVAAAAAAAAQDTRTTFQWQPGHATNSGTRQRRRQLNTCT